MVVGRPAVDTRPTVRACANQAQLGEKAGKRIGEAEEHGPDHEGTAALSPGCRHPTCEGYEESDPRCSERIDSGRFMGQPWAGYWGGDRAGSKGAPAPPETATTHALRSGEECSRNAPRRATGLTVTRKPVTVLREVATLELEPAQPFAFDPTFHKPDHFPSQDTEWEPGVRWQTVRFRGRPFGVRIEDAGSRVRLRMWARGRVSAPLQTALAAELSWRANLRFDLTDFERRARADPKLGAVVRRWRGMRPMHLGSLYEYIVIAIVLQNATVRRSVQMLQALFERYGTQLQFDDRVLYGFWVARTLAGATEHELRALKIGYRARSLLRVSEAIARGDVNEVALREATLKEQRAALLSLYGIGPASAGYILVDVFHAFDELVYISPWEQRIYSRLLLGTRVDEPVPVTVLVERIARWSPWRALAVHYLWEDLFWRHKTKGIDWLAPLIRL